MLKQFPVKVEKQYSEIHKEVMGERDSLVKMREKASAAYLKSIYPLHDMREEDKDQIVVHVGVAACLMSDFQLEVPFKDTRLRDFIRMADIWIWSLPEETLVLLHYLLEGGAKKVSWSVFLGHGLREVTENRIQGYVQKHILEPMSS